MAVTLVLIVIVRIGLAELGRPNYVVPLTFTTHDLSTFSSPPTGFPDAWWVAQASFYDTGGHLLPSGFKYSSQAAYAMQHYQPGDRFWQFQTIESAILTVLAAALIGFRDLLGDSPGQLISVNSRYGRGRGICHRGVTVPNLPLIRPCNRFLSDFSLIFLAVSRLATNSPTVCHMNHCIDRSTETGHRAGRGDN
jgi:hypothetical protein